MTPLVYVICLLWVFGITLYEYGIREPITPTYIYNHTKLNNFGCWFLFILLRILSPVATIMYICIAIIIAIYNIIKYLFTTGRD